MSEGPPEPLTEPVSIRRVKMTRIPSAFGRISLRRWLIVDYLAKTIRPEFVPSVVSIREK